ncbi:MAG TPA: GcrA family cell cycle regulator [Candidatus Cybelea sp.]|nr:GcrA family cell cycle regulator [Candidatus Cybelea sp.]
MTPESIWTETRIEQLSALWKEGLSTAEIGRKLGISKNAVVGKAHRLHLPARPSPIKNPPVRIAVKTIPQSQPQQPAPMKVLSMPKSGAACQWPLGHPGQPGFHFCGKIAVPGKPYCSEHAAKAYVSGKKDEAAA